MIIKLKKINTIKRKETRDYAKNNFSVELIADKYENLYKKIKNAKQ
jgi:hypothetical protein